MAQINPKITIRSVYFGMLLLSAAVMILTVRLTVASELVDSLKAAAEQGDAKAQFGLGLMYALGKGVPKDDVQAYAWVNIGAAQIGDEESGKVFESIAEKMTASAITKAQSLSREYWEAYGSNRASSE